MRPTYLFTEEIIQTILHERFHHPEPRVQERMEILWLKSQHETHERIAELANVSRSTVQRTLRIFSERGLEGIRTFGWKGPVGALSPHRETIEESFRKDPPHTVAEAARRIHELTGVCRKLSRVRLFMRDTLEMKCRKVAPIPVPPKRSVQEHAQTQAAFLKG